MSTKHIGMLEQYLSIVTDSAKSSEYPAGVEKQHVAMFVRDGNKCRGTYVGMNGRNLVGLQPEWTEM